MFGDVTAFTKYIDLNMPGQPRMFKLRTSCYASCLIIQAYLFYKCDIKNSAKHFFTSFNDEFSSQVKKLQMRRNFNYSPS